MSAPLLFEMRNISKSFGGNLVLDNVNLELNQGEVLGLVGENGAGKSTLVKILCGVYSDYMGDIIFQGKKVKFKSPGQALEMGIGIIYQELSVFLDLDVVQNIYINNEIHRNKSKYALLDDKKMYEKAKAILHNELGLDINTKRKVIDLSPAERQLIEIARALIQEKKIIVMDEPTASLESEERKRLFDVVRKLKATGCSVIYISHYLEEILDISDKTMVLRDGKSEGIFNTKELSINKIITLMIGKSLKQQYPKEEVNLGEVLLEVRNLTKKNKFYNVSFDIKRGEILGFAGLEGCGKNEVIRAIFGITKYDQGEIYLNGSPIDVHSIKDAMNKKLAFIPAERKTEGLFLLRDIRWNTTIASLSKISRAYINRKMEKAITEDYIERLKIRTDGSRKIIWQLSGGNQQKVMLARWFMTDPQVLFMEDPTRGIDINAKADVYSLIEECAKNGKSVCIVANEYQELMKMCDRIVVMHSRKVRAILTVKDTTEEVLRYNTVTKGSI